jgi:hypothetical protein
MCANPAHAIAKGRVCMQKANFFRKSRAYTRRIQTPLPGAFSFFLYIFQQALFDTSLGTHGFKEIPGDVLLKIAMQHTKKYNICKRHDYQVSRLSENRA